MESGRVKAPAFSVKIGKKLDTGTVLEYNRLIVYYQEVQLCFAKNAAPA